MPQPKKNPALQRMAGFFFAGAVRAAAGADTPRSVRAGPVHGQWRDMPIGARCGGMDWRGVKHLECMGMHLYGALSSGFCEKTCIEYLYFVIAGSPRKK